MFGIDQNYIDRSIVEMESYHCAPMDFTSLDINKKRICNSGCKELTIDLDKQINLDFIKESEEMEDSFSKNISEFLEDPDTKVVEGLPLDVVFIAGKVGPEYEEIRREAFEKATLLAKNARLRKTKELHCAEHLYALRKLFNEARRSRAQKIKKGEFIPLTHDTICEINEFITQKTSSTPGSYRNPYWTGFTFVSGAKWTPVSNSRVYERMVALLEWYNNKGQNLHPIVRAAILHTELIKIHPFEDGNGRTARLLMNYELIRNGYPSIIIKARKKDNYIKALEKAVLTEDVTDLVGMISAQMGKVETKYLTYIKEVKSIQKQEKNK